MVDISAAIKQAVYDYLTEHGSPAAGLFEARINGMVNRALDGQNQRIGQLETRIEALARRIESTHSQVRELAEQREIDCDLSAKMDGAANQLLQSVDFTSMVSRRVDARLDSRVEEIIDRRAARTSAVLDDRISEEFESHNFTRRVEEVLKDALCVSDYIDWDYVSRNEIDVETLAERMDFAQMMRETVEELEFKVTVR